MKSAYSTFLQSTTALPSITRFRLTAALRMASYMSLYSQYLKLSLNTPPSTGGSSTATLRPSAIVEVTRDRPWFLSVASFLTGSPMPFYVARTQSLFSDFAIWRWLNPEPVLSCLGSVGAESHRQVGDTSPVGKAQGAVA